MTDVDVDKTIMKEPLIMDEVKDKASDMLVDDKAEQSTIAVVEQVIATNKTLQPFSHFDSHFGLIEISKSATFFNSTVTE